MHVLQLQDGRLAEQWQANSRQDASSYKNALSKERKGEVEKKTKEMMHKRIKCQDYNIVDE